MGPAGSDAAEARAPRPLAVDGGGAQHKTNSRGPRRGLGAQVPRRRGGEAGRGQTPSRGDGITAGFWSRYLSSRRPCAELCGGGRAALGWSLRLDDAELKQKTRSASPPRSSASSSIEVLLMQAEAHRASSCCTSSRMLASLWASMMFPWILSFPLMNACMPSSFPLASANISATASVIVTSGFSC
ncbi:unnamed protein product [Prorocentrum cordatum]|uniref:Uncharacterized protein n=1 Tax=Prorocentrum cordatum TaxID=2364126 RepID=A0ABN9TZD7_9DINO|nr:unnamed protein product [Polarella glacialis]